MSRNKHDEPSEAEIDACEYSMTMAQLKHAENGVFARMPKSVLLRGKRVPKTQLRKRDLCRFYLSMGGTVFAKTQPQLKHYSLPQKPSLEQRKYERLMQQRSLDHKGPKSSMHKEDDRTKKRRMSLSDEMDRLSLGKTKRGSKARRKNSVSKTEDESSQEDDL